jgi:aminopeptidase-like protein
MLNKTIAPSAVEEMMSLITELYPICRSITGNGLRETLHKIGNIIPLRITEVPTGTQVLDWEVPKEWNISDAYIKNSAGEKIVDFNNSNLHVLNYSTPVNQKMSLKELSLHIFTIPEKPSLVPYRTSYYNENWGFCMSHDQFSALADEEYEVVIDSDLSPGNLTYGEFYIKGTVEDEVLISTHVCHPSLANDNLTGISVCAHLARALSTEEPYYSYRFIFIPGTIGAITWLAKNDSQVHRIKYGLVTSLLGIDSVFTYKRSRRATAKIDQITEHILSRYQNKIINFIPYGYDERQFCSPGYNLPVGNLCRVPFAQYPEYHTSGDNLEFISPKALEDSLNVFIEIIQNIEADRYFINLFPKGEPQLGKRGLYGSIGGTNDSKMSQMAFLWVLNYSDGNHSLFDISVISEIDIRVILNAADLLLSKGMLKEVEKGIGRDIQPLKQPSVSLEQTVS